jgi:hypothetical protein
MITPKSESKYKIFDVFKMDMSIGFNDPPKYEFMQILGIDYLSSTRGYWYHCKIADKVYSMSELEITHAIVEGRCHYAT